MPAPPKTSDEEVVSAARKLLEKEDLTMQLVATAVGVRAPSLYKRFPDREALLQAVVVDAVIELRGLLLEADRAASPKAALAAMARAYRRFAHRSPRAYTLIFSSGASAPVETLAAGVAPVLARLTALVGEKEALPAARLLTSWLHGFVSMELAGAFRLGGDVDAAFEYSLKTLLGALATR